MNNKDIFPLLSIALTNVMSREGIVATNLKSRSEQLGVSLSVGTISYLRNPKLVESKASWTAWRKLFIVLIEENYQAASLWWEEIPQVAKDDFLKDDDHVIKNFLTKRKSSQVESNFQQDLFEECQRKILQLSNRKQLFLAQEIVGRIALQIEEE
jgi:hypothetical protein